MKDSARARVAAVVASAAAKKSVSSVYDYTTGGHRSVSVDATSGGVTGFDYTTSSHISAGSSGNLGFYDYEFGSHVQLDLVGEQFTGYDYLSGTHFSGTVRNGSVSVFDYETGKHHSYSV